MSGAARLRASSQPPAVAQHCPAEEYAAFVTGCSRSADKKARLRHRHERFVQHFPLLTDWFDQPLRQRLGWRNRETQRQRRGPGEGFDVTAGWVNYNARDYLIYLALTGGLHLDWGWLLGIGVLKPWWISDDLGLPLTAQIEHLQAVSNGLGLSRVHGDYRLSWALIRLALHRGEPDLDTVTVGDIDEMRAAIRELGQIPGLAQVLHPEQLASTRNVWSTSAFRAGVALFHAGVIDQPPARPDPKPTAPLSSQPGIAAVMDRYLTERALRVRPETMSASRAAMRRLGRWLTERRPVVESLAELTRDDLLEFLTWLAEQRKIRHPEQPLSDVYRRSIISEVTVFFRHGAHAEWPDMPDRPVLMHSDIPRSVQRIPRYIPEHQLEPVMAAIRELDCPLQRCALLVARWSGARRSEIRRLHLDCLDSYPDGTARLRLAVGKSLRERMVPLHPEAADAIRLVIKLRERQHHRGLYDRDLGQRVRYLFLHNGGLATADYLFAAPLGRVSEQIGILTGDGKPGIHAHRFRHTLGTQMAERGARIETIMKIFEHASAGMSLVYTSISDPMVLADYRAVMQPGAILAGPLAATLRRGELDETTVNWLNTNFYKTELELGRCLRLPQEGPCECDLYLSCAKFVTTPQYAPRLRDRLRVEANLISDAVERGWEREAERHRGIADRIRSLIVELDRQTSAIEGARDS